MINKSNLRKVHVGSPQYFEIKEGNLEMYKLSRIILDLPFRCNFNCPKCYRKGCEQVEFDDDFMELRKRAIIEAKGLGAKIVTIVGEGEPLFFWTQLKELIEFINEQGMVTILYTTGALLNESNAKYLYDSNVSLIISLDSLAQDTYHYLTGGGELVKVLPRLERVKELYSGSEEYINNVLATRLAFITIVSEQNRNEISKIHKWVGNNAFHIVNFLIKGGAAVENWNKLTNGNVTEHAKIANKYTDTGVGGLSSTASHKKCTAVYNGITIDIHGRALACPASVKTEVGNINALSISDIFENTKEYARKLGNPVCIASDVLHGETPAREHDGIIGPRLSKPIKNAYQ